MTLAVACRSISTPFIAPEVIVARFSSGYSPHYVMLVVAPPLNDASQEHMALCLALKLPFFIVVNKVDLGFCGTSEILIQLENAMRTQSYSKKLVPFSSNDVPSWDYSSDVIPVFSVSCITGEGLEELTMFIKNLAPYETDSIDSDSESCLFQIDETFRYVQSSFHRISITIDAYRCLTSFKNFLHFFLIG